MQNINAEKEFAHDEKIYLVFFIFSLLFLWCFAGGKLISLGILMNSQMIIVQLSEY